MVALGKKPCADGRIPLSDGAGEVVAVSDDVQEFKVGDAVVSTYWPHWLAGEPTPANKKGELGDDVDGYARVCVHALACLHKGTGRLHACGGGNAYLCRRHRLESPDGVRPGEAW
ncbi:hypothetical protein [Mesorhizobium sp. M1300]|uniref:hypothetical protein n=1 Tax=Mesorhizobium sp. M1300 TaxID=2957077 RepID=UPI00333C0957